MLWATGGGSEATAFGGTGSDVAMKREYCDFKWRRELWGRGAGAAIVSGGSLTLNIGLWGLMWETSTSVRESWRDRNKCVGLCCKWRQPHASVCYGSWRPLKRKKGLLVAGGKRLRCVGLCCKQRQPQACFTCCSCWPRDGSLEEPV